MSIDFDADLDLVLADASNASSPNVVYGAQSTYGFLSHEQKPVLEEGMAEMVRTTTLYIREGSLTNLAVDAAITVDGVAYVIRNPDVGRADGRLKPVEVAKV